MSLTDIDELLETLELIVKRKQIIKELYPDKKYQQSELAEKTGIAKGNLSKYVSELEEKNIINVVPSVNDRGQHVRIIRLNRISIDTIGASSKLLSAGKPVLEDIESFNMFMDGLFDPDLQEVSMNSIQILSNQYIIPVNSGYFEFLRDNLLKEELDRSRRILIKSTSNMMRELDEEDRKQVVEILEPVLLSILDNSSGGLERETNVLLNELGLYNQQYSELEKRYFSEIKKHKVPEFIRILLLQNHREKIPKLRASLMVLHRESDDLARSIIMDEFPLLR